MDKISSEIVKRIKFLRSHGYSVPEISKETNVSKTTVLRYVKEVQILPEYLSEWAGKRGGSRKIRLKKEARALEEGKSAVGELTHKEKLLFLSALYWGEGSKKDFELINSDPYLIKFFIETVREVFGLDNNRIRVSIRVYEDLNKNDCLEFWSTVTRITTEEFGRIDTLKGRKSGKLKYGMCRVRILKGGDLLKKIVGINKAISILYDASVAQRTE